jgi:hypothetical protein
VAGGKRRCDTQNCGRAATGRREKGRWIPYTKCKRCFVVGTLEVAVKAWTANEMRYQETELRLLRALEGQVRKEPPQPRSETATILAHLLTLRSLQNESRESSAT